jgi:methylase of polypeptide subunit release factors
MPDGEWLKFYDSIFRFSKGHLKEGGVIYAEIHESSGEELNKLASGFGYDKVRIIKDLSGRERFFLLKGFQPL